MTWLAILYLTCAVEVQRGGYWIEAQPTACSKKHDYSSAVLIPEEPSNAGAK